MKIGVVGYSSNAIDNDAARDILIKSFRQIAGRNEPHEPIEIVSGLTNIGIPKIAYQLADELGFIKVGISAERALQVKCGIYSVHKQIIVGREFGDESSTFIHYIDFLIRIGGGTQSHQEVKMFTEKCIGLGIKLSDYLVENELSLKTVD